MAAEAQQSPVEADSNGHAHQLAPSLSDVQLVEAFFDLEGRLEAALAAAGHPAAAPQAAALKQQLNAVFDSMARDLQQTMLSSPQRAALLHNSGPHPKVPGQPQPSSSL